MLHTRLAATAAALSLVTGIVLSSTPAQAQWRRGWGHGGWGPGPGAVVGGALLGLGVGTLLAAPYYRPPVVYAPPPAYYPPPPYAYAPPAYYATPYYAPGYYAR